MSSACRVVAMSAFVLGIAVAPAHAYLDPGTGSIILQGVIGAVAAGLFVARSYLYRVRSWLVREKPPVDEPPAR